VCLLSTSAYSALEVLHIMRYINLLTYLLSYGIVVKIFVYNVKVYLQITGLNDAADLQMSLELMS